MTQSLLDLSTLLNTNNDAGFKPPMKDYAETYSNGKSFNEIFSSANNNLKDKGFNNSSKFSFNDSIKKSSTSQNNLNKNERNIGEKSREQNSQKNALVQNQNKNINQEAVKTVKSEVKVSTNDKEITKDKSSDKSTTVDSKEKTNVNALKNVNIKDLEVDENLLASIDFELINLDETSVEDVEVEETDVCINAYYQSTLNSLKVDSADSEIQEVVAEEVIDENVNIAKATLNTIALNDLNKSIADDSTTEDASATAGLSKNSEKTDITAKSDVTDTKSQKAEEIVPDKKSEKINEDIKIKKEDNLVQVETNVKDEKTNAKILVKVAENIVDEVQKIDVTKTDKKVNAKEVLEKVGLGDSEMKTLNVTVTEVGNSSTDLSNGFGSQGNAQETIAKISLQPGEKLNTQNPVDKSFSKLVDTTKVEDPKEISKNEILTQISNKMQAQSINGKNKITLMLTPESLGKVTIELIKGKNGMEARMLTGNAQVKDILEKNIDGLKSALSNQGVSVNNVSVKVSSASESSGEFSFNREQFAGEENSQQRNFGDSENKKEDDSTFATNSKDEDLINGELLANGEIENEDGEILSSQIGNVDLEA